MTQEGEWIILLFDWVWKSWSWQGGKLVEEEWQKIEIIKCDYINRGGRENARKSFKGEWFGW